MIFFKQGKCPIEFQEIGNKCYWFSSENLNWQDARKKCESKYHYSDLLDLNNQQDLKDLFNHIRNQSEIKKLFSRMHVRIELATNTGTEKSNIVNEYNFDAESIIFRTCGKTAKRNAFEQNYEMSDFESSISSEDVITFYNSKIYNNQQCISIIISNNSGEFDYCVKFKNCHSKFPFVCKINTDKIVEKFSGDYYPDSLHNYQQDPKMSYVINALLAVTHGLARIHKNVCEGLPGLCDGMKKITGNELFTNIRESSFSGITGEKIDFDSNGDPPGRYVILNVQKEFNKFDNSTRYVYKEVGSWNNENRLSLNLSKLVFPNSEQNFVSICSKECDFGYVKQIKQGGLKCCWNCKKCEEYSYILDDHTCQECDLGYWPNKNLTGCDKLSLKYLKWSEPASIFALLVSTIGILINTFVTHIFVRFSDTSVVKSTTKQLSFIILFGIYLCYLTTIPLVLKPSLISCYLTRILPGLNLSIIYGALLTKTNRIARILSQSKKRFFTKKLRFMSITSQILISLVIISFECCLIITGLFYEPKVIYVNYSKRSEARLECSIERVSVIGPLGYNMFLVAMCTLYAIQTRNLPENFNEAKFIGFSMYTTCVIWIAFFPLFFGSDFKVITLSLSISFSATVILAFLFIPKVYIIIFEPEKNQRSAFTTTKNLRCHIGSNMQSSSFLDYDMPSSQRKKSNGMFLLAGLAGLRTPSQITESKPKYSINYTRYAFRPKISKFYGYGEKKSIDSMDNGMSIYQISDRSCQTSLEYLPILKDSIKKRKGTRIERRNSIDELNKNEKENDANNFGALGALGNILFLPLIATNKKKEELDKQENFEHDSDDENKDDCFRISTDSFKNKHLEEKYCPDQSVGLAANIEKKENLIFVEENEDLNSNNESNLEECDALSNEPTVDDYSDKMNHEDESLEDLRKIFTKNRNLVLQWDYVQSSGYL
ncbi:Metabotropic glutamate receptor 1 [Brachionus plicatilis]|uniref:Metabotropic glutamate receptor 1 n=1 Tax=Brachionus plicatilis TaxID=10195 RepID=A0A3M7QQF1_BRAPC|nr:Metabotropic glutamate receptor 1 [Brachionus plicatilis]